jgi:hypothetical protein
LPQDLLVRALAQYLTVQVNEQVARGPMIETDWLPRRKAAISFSSCLRPKNRAGSRTGPRAT